MNFIKINLRNKKEIIKRLTKPEYSLSERTIKGGIWVFTLRIGSRLFQLTRTIILARLLSPNDFGLFGIALLALSALDTFSQTGFRQALIQKKEDTKPYLDTAWTAGIIRGLLIAAILFFAAPYAATFFKAPPAEPILKVIGLAIILQSLTNIAVIYFEKELEFNKYFTYQFAGTIVDVTVAISAAFLLRSVWALVFGLLAGNLVRCIASYLIDPYRPRLYFDFPKAKGLFKFGKWIFGSSILIFLVTHGGDIFVGKLFGATALGFYQMAYRISNMPTTEITHVISRVTFPAYSKLQDELGKLRKAYLKVLQTTTLISLPIAGLVIVLASAFTHIILGEKWVPMIPAMQILAVGGAIRSIGACTGPLFQGVGKPKLSTIMQAIRLVLMVIIIYPLTIRFGLVGAALTVTITGLIVRPITDTLVVRVIKVRAWEYIRTILLPLTGTVTACLFVYLFDLYVFKAPPLFSLLVSALLGVGSYVFMVLFLEKIFGYKPLRNILFVINEMRRSRK